MSNYYIKPSLHSNRSRDAVALARDFEKGLVGAERRTPKALQTRWTRGIILQKIFKLMVSEMLFPAFSSVLFQKKKNEGKAARGQRSVIFFRFSPHYSDNVFCRPFME